jgi:hypothetical protein
MAGLQTKDFRYTVPSLISLALFTVFMFPTMGAIQLAVDNNVVYWFGRWILVCLVVPFMLLWQYWYHSVKTGGQAKKVVILACVLIPCLIFFFSGVVLLFQGSHLFRDLASPHCQDFDEIRGLEASYREAKEFHACCLKRAGVFEAAPFCTDPHVPMGIHEGSFMTIQHCDGYQSLLADHKENFDYLKFLEDNYGCTGFCNPNWLAIWSVILSPREGCAHAAASVVEGKIMHIGWQLTCYAPVVFLAYLIWSFMVPFGGAPPAGRMLKAESA